ATAAMHIAPSANARHAHPFSFSDVFNRNMRLLPLIRHGQPGAAFREGLSERTRINSHRSTKLWRGNALWPRTQPKFTPNLAPATTALTPSQPVATSRRTRRRVPCRERSRLLLPTASAHIDAVR